MQLSEKYDTTKTKWRISEIAAYFKREKNAL